MALEIEEDLVGELEDIASFRSALHGVLDFAPEQAINVVRVLDSVSDRQARAARIIELAEELDVPTDDIVSLWHTLTFIRQRTATLGAKPEAAIEQFSRLLPKPLDSSLVQALQLSAEQEQEVLEARIFSVPPSVTHTGVRVLSQHHSAGVVHGSLVTAAATGASAEQTFSAFFTEKELRRFSRELNEAADKIAQLRDDSNSVE